ncbi:MAG: hypothetical protein LBU60_01890 [Clostridiales bacterium]|jgi:hypothetical protein|nr:hypothetical protein [Clostridiales bacterium]
MDRVDQYKLEAASQNLHNAQRRVQDLQMKRELLGGLETQLAMAKSQSKVQFVELERRLQELVEAKCKAILLDDHQIRDSLIEIAKHELIEQMKDLKYELKSDIASQTQTQSDIQSREACIEKTNEQIVDQLREMRQEFKADASRAQSNLIFSNRENLMDKANHDIVDQLKELRQEIRLDHAHNLQAHYNTHNNSHPQVTVVPLPNYPYMSQYGYPPYLMPQEMKLVLDSKGIPYRDELVARNYAEQANQAAAIMSQNNQIQTLQNQLERANLSQNNHIYSLQNQLERANAQNQLERVNVLANYGTTNSNNMLQNAYRDDMVSKSFSEQANQAATILSQNNQIQSLQNQLERANLSQNGHINSLQNQLERSNSQNQFERANVMANYGTNASNHMLQNAYQNAYRDDLISRNFSDQAGHASALSQNNQIQSLQSQLERANLYQNNHINSLQNQLERSNAQNQFERANVMANYGTNASNHMLQNAYQNAYRDPYLSKSFSEQASQAAAIYSQNNQIQALQNQLERANLSQSEHIHSLHNQLERANTQNQLERASLLAKHGANGANQNVNLPHVNLPNIHVPNENHTTYSHKSKGRNKNYDTSSLPQSTGSHSPLDDMLAKMASKLDSLSQELAN